MDIALLQELKDAGWPQVRKLGGMIYDEEVGTTVICTMLKGKDHGPLDWGLVIPTREELIEACGENYILQGTPSFGVVARYWLALQRKV